MTGTRQLEAGHWVICDRFSDSTRVYQGVAGGLPKGVIEALERLVVDDSVPDVTIMLDLPAQDGLGRVKGRRGQGHAAAKADNYEGRPLSYHERLRDGFLMIATAEPERCVVVDAMQLEEEVAEQVWTTIEMRLIQQQGD